MEKIDINPAMDELYSIKEANSLRHINMSTTDIKSELKNGIEEFEKLIAESRKEIAKK